MDSVDPFKRSNCTPRTPNKVVPGESQSDSVVDTPGQKRPRELVWSPENEPLIKKPNVSEAVNHTFSVSGVNGQNVDNFPEASVENNFGPGFCGENNSTFAAVLKNNEDLQVAFYADPPKPFSSENRLDFVDAMGDIIAKSDDVPYFESTVCRDNFLIVTAGDDFSYQWLLTNAVNVDIGQGFPLKLMPAREIPKLKKILLWLPGRRILPDAEILVRFGKANPSISCKEWRVFSRKDEPHGCRLLVGVDEASFGNLQAVHLKPYWSTVRGQVTPVDDMIAMNVERKKRHIKAKARYSGRVAPGNSEKPIESNKLQLSQRRGDVATASKSADVIINNNVKLSDSGKSSPSLRKKPPTKANRNALGNSGKITSYLTSATPAGGQQINFENVNRFNVLQDLTPGDDDCENISVADEEEVPLCQSSSRCQK